ncbi:MAG: hypothetical protein J5679_00950 [Alphaproteobacteria bacterium]|nr:hypothetical protein [Alphaproteobacteria bacterium]
MMRIYVAAAIAAAIFLSYIAGAHMGNVRCQIHTGDTATKQLVNNIQLAEDTNEMVLHTGVDDVRRILHEKYSIAE